jgi:hypothetical protein
VVPPFRVTPAVLWPFWMLAQPVPTCQNEGRAPVEEVPNRSVLAVVDPERVARPLDPAELLNTMLFRSNGVSNCEMYPPAV